MNRLCVRGRLPAAAVLAVVLAAAPGCEKMVAPPSKLRFNDRIARNIKKIGMLAVALREAADPEKATEPPDPTNIHNALAKLEDEVRKLRDEAENMQLPRNPSATETQMLEKYKEFLKDQQRILETHVAKYVRIAEDRRLDKAARRAALDEQMSLINAEESKTRDPLVNLQAQLAKDRNFQLVNTKR